MNEQDVNPGTAADGDTLDDVEAHGMKEVVAGLSAAAVLAGGAAAVVAHQGNDSGGGANRIEATSTLGGASDSALLDTPAGLSAPGSATSISLPSAAVSDLASSALGTTADVAAEVDDDVVSPNRPTTMDRADSYVDGRVDQVRDLRDSVLDTTSNVVDASVGTVRETVREGQAEVRETRGTASETVQRARQGTVSTPEVRDVVSDARAKVDATIVLAGDTVRAVEGMTTSTIARIQPGVGSNVSIEDMSGWVTVSAGGQTLARVEVKDGQASVSWEAPSAELPVVVHYSGSDVLNAASVTL